MRRPSATLGIALLLGACGQILAGADDDGDAGVGTNGEGGVTDGSVIEASSNGCPSGRGPAMVLVELPAGLRFCIDSTEVTRAQYEGFLASIPDPAAQIDLCKSNKDFRPNDPGDAALAAYPIVTVDWCDAYAFCAWAGKRLCGELDGGGALPFDAAGNFQRSEWTAACTRYGTASNTNAKCNTGNPEAGAWPPGSKPECTGYPGVFDMIGNVTEWENACFASDGGRRCADRGGSYRSGGGCSFVGTESPSGFGSDWGVRCCASPR